MPDGSHHREGQHDERDVAMPAMAGPGFAAVKPQLVLRRFKAVLDGSAATVASNRDIGNMMIASSSFNVPLVFARLFVLAGLGVSLYAIFSLIEHRITGWTNRKTDLAAG